MKYLVFFASIFVVATAQAQVGIGTTSPSTNAALDVSSATKGLMLPRLNDTSTVSNPSAGLMIYSKQAQSPAYHNGTRWNTLASKTNATAAGRDSITYTITFGTATNGFTTGTFGASTIVSASSNSGTTSTGGGGSAGRVTYEDLVITKPVDANSIGFARVVSNGAHLTTIEFKVFAAGATTPRYSIKLTDIITSAYTVSIDGSARLMEQISFKASIYGYKNWLTNQSTAWDITRNTLVTY
jgi:type VI protein secretion system component Hcp